MPECIRQIGQIRLNYVCRFVQSQLALTCHQIRLRFLRVLHLDLLGFDPISRQPPKQPSYQAFNQQNKKNDSPRIRPASSRKTRLRYGLACHEDVCTCVRIHICTHVHMRACTIYTCKLCCTCCEKKEHASANACVHNTVGGNYISTVCLKAPGKAPLKFTLLNSMCFQALAKRLTQNWCYM